MVGKYDHFNFEVFGKENTSADDDCEYMNEDEKSWYEKDGVCMDAYSNNKCMERMYDD